MSDNLTLDPTAEANWPSTVEAELIDTITEAIRNHPRSQQVAIGPSEVGMTCTRRLIRKLAGIPEPEGATPWLPTIGTAMHTWLAEQFAEIYKGRYVVEGAVNVGSVAGQDVYGHCDLFDTMSGTVIDWKILGKASLDRMRLHGPKPEYRVQAHLYGAGYGAIGAHVNTVMIVGLPRNDISLNGRIMWSEPFDPTVAKEALQRCTDLVELTTAIGVEAAVNLYPHCNPRDTFCPYCPTPAPKAATGINEADPFGSTKGNAQ